MQRRGPVSFSVDLSSLDSVTLLGLAAIRSSALFLLVSAHACAQGDVYPRRRLESKTLGHFHQIKLVYIEDRPQTV